MKNELIYYLKKFDLEKCIKNEFFNKLYLKHFEKGEMIFSVEEESQIGRASCRERVCQYV